MNILSAALLEVADALKKQGNFNDKATHEAFASTAAILERRAMELSRPEPGPVPVAFPKPVPVPIPKTETSNAKTDD